MNDTLTTPLRLISEIRRELDSNVLPCLTAPARIRDLRMAIDMLDYVLIWLRATPAPEPMQQQQDLLEQMRTLQPGLPAQVQDTGLLPFPPLASAEKALADAEIEAHVGRITVLGEASTAQQSLALESIRCEQAWMDHELRQLSQR
ncbi:MAG: hypothetical protein JJU22_16950, partial [Gammaproteobacteria bacterium]|nr:hypothetical protein [Gammaproteobacteria bacterium]